MSTVYSCPCCGYLSFDEPPGSYQICSICFWEDDIVQLAFPDLAGGANRCSLIEGQRNFISLGTCEERLLPHTRQPTQSDQRDTEWRPLEPAIDPHLQWGEPEDHELWQSVKDKDTQVCLYYWRREYWLADRLLPGSQHEH